MRLVEEGWRKQSLDRSLRDTIEYPRKSVRWLRKTCRPRGVRKGIQEETPRDPQELQSTRKEKAPRNSNSIAVAAVAAVESQRPKELQTTSTWTRTMTEIKRFCPHAFRQKQQQLRTKGVEESKMRKDEPTKLSERIALKRRRAGEPKEKESRMSPIERS